MSLKTTLAATTPKYVVSQIAKNGLSAMRSVVYSGDQVYCPCCSGSFRKFLPAGIHQARLNAECPKCFSLERHRLLWLYLQNKTNLLTSHLKVLHFAPEFQLYKALRTQSNLEYITADLSAPRTMVNVDIMEMPFEDASFDVIICNHVLEHVPDDHKAMRELYRILRPNGWAILQVPLEADRATTFEDPSVTSPAERERIFGQKDHLRVYGRDYRDRLQAVGFTVRVDDYIHELGSNDSRKYGLVSDDANSEDIYFCSKP